MSHEIDPGPAMQEYVAARLDAEGETDPVKRKQKFAAVAFWVSTLALLGIAVAPPLG